MDIYWLKDSDLDEIVKEGEKENWLMDRFELEYIHSRYPELCYGIYDDSTLCGSIMGYRQERTAWISNFLIKENYRQQGFGRRLFETLLTALNREESIYLNAEESAIKFYQRYGFRVVIPIVRMYYKQQEMKFKFSTKDAQELEKTNLAGNLYKLDRKVFKENRSEFLQDITSHKSSLKLYSKNGFNHSRVINSKYVFLGPFEALDGAYLDLEKLLRGVIFLRGMKKGIYVDVPDIDNITSLYKSYNFEVVSRTYQMVLGTRVNIAYDNIFGFSTTGTCG
jgi:GNAT superfamily N-acetyltransferase